MHPSSIGGWSSAPRPGPWPRRRDAAPPAEQAAGGSHETGSNHPVLYCRHCAYCSISPPILPWPDLQVQTAAWVSESHQTTASHSTSRRVALISVALNISVAVNNKAGCRINVGRRIKQ